jgi:thioredoxin-dependent peroxiredoxin
MSDKLSPGDVAPAFSLPDSEGTVVSLANYPGSKVIVYFYPAAMTPGCTTQAVDFTAASHDFDVAGYHVVGISPDKPEKLAKFRAKESLTVTLLGDPSLEVLRAYAAYGSKMLYGKEFQGVIRSTFIVDVDEAGVGTIAQAQYNVRATGHVAKLRRELGI